MRIVAKVRGYQRGMHSVFVVECQTCRRTYQTTGDRADIERRGSCNGCRPKARDGRGRFA
jgi:cation transport regulator ChaC